MIHSRQLYAIEITKSLCNGSSAKLNIGRKYVCFRVFWLDYEIHSKFMAIFKVHNVICVCLIRWRVCKVIWRQLYIGILEGRSISLRKICCNFVHFIYTQLISIQFQTIEFSINVIRYNAYLFRNVYKTVPYYLTNVKKLSIVCII